MVGTSGEFGYWFGQKARGKGFATEAATAVLDRYFADHTRQAIGASHMDENKPSQRLLRRLGFVDIGPIFLKSIARNTAMAGRKMELTREAWETRRNG